MGRFFCLILTLPCWVALAQTPNVVVSQIYGGGGNSGATLKNDFVELFNRTAAPVRVTGWRLEYASATGAFNLSTTLSGTIPANGYYLIAQAQGAGGALDLPTPDVSGVIAMSATAARIRVLLGDSSQLELVNYSGLSNTTAYVRREAGCGDGFTVSPPAPRNSASTMRICGAAPQPRELTISQIQGTGLASPHERAYVTTRGIVTQRRPNGFYIESQIPERDNDPATSEGLFVFTSAAPPAAAALNNLVRVTGTVTEFNTVTELTDPVVETIAAVTPLPTPPETPTLEPASRLTEWERFEGMQRTLGGLRVTSPTGGTIDDATATATSNGILWAAPANLPIPSAEPAPADGNPERVRVTTDAGDLTAFDTFASISGALDFADGAWSIAAKAFLGFRIPAPLPRALTASPNELAVATFNLRRFFDDRDDPGAADPVLTTEAFNRRLTKTALHISTLLGPPAILAVQEAENLNALEQLATKLGGSWRAYLQEGNDPSGIDTGFLVDTARVTVQSVTQLEKSNPIHDRPPLLLRATAQGLAMAVVAVHQRSLINAADPAVREKRQAQANAIAHIAAGLRNENTIVLGDFNAHPFDDGNGDMLRPLLDAGFVRLGASLPIEHAYTFVQNGQLQELDHIFVSPSMNLRLAHYESVHTNARFPVTDFNLTADPQRASDHDVPMARFHLGASPPAIRAAGLVNAATLQAGPIAAGQLATLFGSGFTANTVLLFGTGANLPAIANVFFRSPGQINFTVPDLPAATTTVQVVDGETTVAGFELRTADTAPGLFTQNGSGTGLAAALNQDSTLNSQANPAPRGSIVQLFGTGIPSVAGSITAGVSIGGRDAQIHYAGQAPGLVAGAAQINAYVPSGVTPGLVEVLVTSTGATSRRGVQIWVR